MNSNEVELKQKIQKLSKGIKCVRELIDNSTGVAGLNLNGDIAPWEDLDRNGHMSEWLTQFNHAEDLLRLEEEEKGGG